ncbi:sec-independent protein translocase protein TatC [Allocatelliglobosispora scoriae]|uniref:Sec-independent protein translocase protein TatC n=1 Tax=Allocatelliglobosispora scoriae TaxID=643052 RepID=A0A841C3H5_9ACTN|nr:twin-arginine translocase subunit TatC [Allocatelliglobosispora scoriae]MBB5873869.1 sec-independent protein translocase protein TatC [Allocatelliglobosispora scoriae]
MTLIEHIRELRSRLTRATLAILVGVIVGYFLSTDIFKLIQEPYCSLQPDPTNCQFVSLEVTAQFMLKLKLALWAGLVLSSPVWLYQLWAFIAPGLHRHERKWAYIFGAIAGPLFMTGAVLAYVAVHQGLKFLLEQGFANVAVTLEIGAYTSFITNFVLLFGASFEFPVLLLLLNFSGAVTGRRMLGWWRIAIFLCFVFAAITTPDPGPFGMTLLALALSLLFFGSVGVALINDKRRARKERKLYGDIGDDEVSKLDDLELDEVEAGEPVAAPKPIERRYDEMT